MESTSLGNQKLSTAKKEAQDKKWYKEQADSLDNHHSTTYSVGGDSQKSLYRKMKVNYDLFNNIIDLAEFQYVCEPLGAESGQLPARMVNRDIVSGKVKAMLGMEMKRPFSFKVLATNPEATTRKEQEEFGRLKEHVISEIMLPIRQAAEQEYMAESKGRELTENELQDLNVKIEEETKANTPEEVKRYMERDHQDPAEVMANQLLQYKIKEQDAFKKFNDGFKHGLLSAKEVYYVGILNGDSLFKNANSMRFDCDKSPDTNFIEDGEWAACEYPMTISNVIKYFGDELKPTEIDKLYEENQHHHTQFGGDFFSFDEYEESSNDTVRVLHCTWKSLRKIGFLDYIDKNGEQQKTYVNEGYKLEKEKGDLKIEWHWLPESYETWKIGTDMYVHMRPVAGQFKDTNNMYNSKLPYYGVIYDDMNSEETSFMDRIKTFQYFFNIIMYRLELLIASDKGKKILMNVNSIPSSAGMDIKKWQYFFESSSIGWIDPSEEGAINADINTVAKVVDLSLVSDIGKYIDIAEYLKRQCGESVGLTAQMEGQISSSEAVTNTQQNIIQSSHILEPYFYLHSQVKKNVLGALLESTKIAAIDNGIEKYAYVLDDMSTKLTTLDLGLLDSSTLGLFIEDGTKAAENKELLRGLTHAAIQSQKAELSDMMTLIRQDSIVEAEETLKVAEDKRREHELSMNKQTTDSLEREKEKDRNFKREEHEMNKELVILKEEEKRETEIQKAAIMASSFNPDVDKDGDGINDYLEIAKHGVDHEVKTETLKLNREKFEQEKIRDKEKLQLEKQKLAKK